MKIENAIFFGVVGVILANLGYRVIDWYFDVKSWPGIRHARSLLGLEPKPRTPDAFSRRELMKVMLSLDEGTLDELFALYRERYGAGAYRYARKTHREWKSGSVRPVTRTFQRFLVDLPQVMSFDMKCEVLRRFMDEFAVKDAVELDVTLDDWETKLKPVVETMIERNYTLRLPAEVERRLRWLGENDMQAASVILRRAMADESRVAVSMLDDEFAGLATVFADARLRPKVRHEIKLPCGTIKVNVKRG